MYPSIKDMDAVHSGTGVFYQAIPAVGADGKNIMKLIPVQMVDGQFFKTQMSKPQTDPTPQKAVSINIASAPVQMVKKAALNPSATQQTVRKQVSLVNALPNQVGLDLGNPLNKHQHLTAKVPQMATPATNCGKSVRPPRQLPVTVKSPALPRGQYLQIPPNAQVRTVPASDLPAGIKKQIFTSSASCSPGSGLPSVVYVSPVTTVNQGVTPPSDSALHLLPKTSDITSCGSPSKGSKPHLTLIPKVSQRPNSPIKWVIEEEDSSTAPSLDPIHSPSVTSEILRAVAERENAGKHCDVSPKAVSRSSQGKERENALVMCNGKVFFVAKKCSEPFKMGKSDSPTKIVPSSQQPLESAAPQIRPDLRIIIPDEPDEVIDLCDDDSQDDSSQQAASVNVSAVTHLDEDNVIFVSYIPPKSDSGSVQMGTSSSNSVAEQKSLDGTTGGEVSALRGRKPEQRVSVSTVETLTHVCGSAVKNINGQQSNSTQQLESTEVDVETESPADPSTSDSSSGICSPIEKDTHKMESSMNTSSLAPKSRQMDDRLLRQIFGITADVKICLQRIDEASAGSVPAEPPQRESTRSVEDHQEPTSGPKGKKLLLQDLYSPQEADSCNGVVDVKRVRVLSEQELAADPATPHTDTGPLKCSHFKLNTKPLSALKNKCHSGQSSLRGASCDVETEPVIGYVEPIDEDFLSADENDIPNSQDTAARPQTQTCVDLNTNTRRMGRTRKRTRCPCCIPGTQDPAVKSSAKSEEPEKKWAWTTEQTSKKGGRTKAVRKDVKTSGRISCLTAKNKQKCKTSEGPASELLSTTSMDSDDLKRHEQIRRLKELLKEKEAALELMRTSMS